MDAYLELNSTQTHFLKKKLIPLTRQRIMELVLVKPTTENLFIQRKCTALFPVEPFGLGGKCAKIEAIPTCNQLPIPLPFLQEFRYCNVNHLLPNPNQCSTIDINPENKHCCGYMDDSTNMYHDQKVLAPGGTGANNTDLLIFVTATSNKTIDKDKCGEGKEGTAAFASHCSQDQNDRPIAGLINFCPEKLQVDENVHSQVDTALHELMHVMAFSSTLFPWFRDLEGKPRTTRHRIEGYFDRGRQESKDFPPMDSCNKYLPDNTTVETKTLRNQTVFHLVTPAVVREVRAHFALNHTCIVGGELENEGKVCNGILSPGSHFETRLFNDEMMTPTTATGNRAPFSKMSLAVLEDSGWYQVNYSNSMELIWGRKEGCSFFTQKCVEKKQVTSDLFCNVKDQFGCNYDHSAVSQCKTQTYSSIPTPFQYFTDQYTGGFRPEMDYCPTYQLLANKICTDNSNGDYLTGLKMVGATISDQRNWYGETYGTNSLCIQSTLTEKETVNFTLTGYFPMPFTPKEPIGAGCYKHLCGKDHENQPQLQIYVATLGSSANGTNLLDAVTCNQNQQGELRAIPGYRGSLICPNIDRICLTAGEYPPTKKPTFFPTIAPTTTSPTKSPSFRPSNNPTISPSTAKNLQIQTILEVKGLPPQQFIKSNEIYDLLSERVSPHTIDSLKIGVTHFDFQITVNEWVLDDLCTASTNETHTDCLVQQLVQRWSDNFLSNDFEIKLKTIHPSSSVESTPQFISDFIPTFAPTSYPTDIPSTNWWDFEFTPENNRLLVLIGYTLMFIIILQIL